MKNPESPTYDPAQSRTIGRLCKQIQKRPDAGKPLSDIDPADSTFEKKFKELFGMAPGIRYVHSLIDGSTLHEVFVLYVTADKGDLKGPGILIYYTRVKPDAML